MRLVKLLSFLLTFAVFLGAAMAADNPTSAAASGEYRIPIVPSGSGTFSMTSRNDDASSIVRLDRGQRVELNPLAGVCFTMRTYKVKPTERLQDNDTGLRGHSTCQMGSDYRVRSVDGPTSK